MKTNEELKLLCESGSILDVELTDEEVLNVDGGLLEPQDFLKFTKKYGVVLKKRAVSSEFKLEALFNV